MLDFSFSFNKKHNSELIFELNDIFNSITFDSKKKIADQMMSDSPVFESILEDYTDENNPLQDTYH